MQSVDLVGISNPHLPLSPYQPLYLLEVDIVSGGKQIGLNIPLTPTS